jgi:uncharacterized cupin superfamily protein
VTSEAGPGLVVVGPGEGRQVVRLNGEETIVKVGKADTRNAYGVRANRVPPGFASVPRHVHRDAEEAFYVLAGQLAVWAAGERVDAPAGTFVLVTRGTVHSLANLGDEPVRWLTVISPAAVAEWVEAEHELLLTSDGRPDPEALAAIHRRFGLEIVGPPPAW